MYPKKNLFSTNYNFNGNGNYVVFNTESLYWYYKNKLYRNIVLGSEKLFCDGIGVVIAYFLKAKLVKRRHGPDILKKYINNNAYHHIIVGGCENAHQKLAMLIDPSVKISYIGGEIDISRKREVVDKINDTNMDTIVWVCLGIVKQEIFMEKLNLKNKAIVIGVGAAIDFVSQNKKRSNILFQFAGLEWLPRLFKEARMLKRILLSLYGMYFFLKS